MKTLKKMLPKFLAVFVAMVAVFIFHGGGHAAALGYSKSDVEASTVQFTDNTAKTIQLSIGGKTYSFGGTANSDGTIYTYKLTNPIIFCNPNGTPPLPQLVINVDSSQQPITGTIDSSSVMYAGTSAGSCSQDLTKNNNVQVVGAAGDTLPSASDDTSCRNNSHTGLEWLFCPILTAVSDAANELNTAVEDQLNFNTANFLPNKVESAWAIIKDIATSLVVILMLVMVISQAISAGPFDAYTIRKVLPKLVVAVIFMQISWDLCKVIIEWANDAGHGIGYLLAAPFGGTQKLGLASLLQNLNGAWAAGASVSLVGFLFAGAFLAVLFLPGIAMVAFSLLVAVMVALASVLARNIFIIALVIFSPLAIIAWTLNNTQSYWKQWKDNFTKLLLLFPMMMGLIYVGRVFAYLAGNLGNPGPLDFIMVLVGFFGPYFYLPKAFKWGGNLMTQATNAIGTSGALKKINEGGRKIIKDDFGKYWQGRMARDLYDPYDKTARLGMYKVGGIPLPVLKGRLGGRIGAKHLMPTAHGRAQTLREGATWAGERREDAKAFNRRRFELALEKGYAVDEHGNSFTPGDGEDRYERDGATFIKDLNGKERRLGMIEDLDQNGMQQFNADGSVKMKATIWGAGTGAAKQSLVDMVSLENSGDERISKDAVEQLIQTSSNPEIENSFISYGKNKGKRVFEADSTHEKLGAWEKEVGGSQQLYPEEAKANYDLQVHLNRNSYGGDTKIQGRTMAERIADLTKDQSDPESATGKEVQEIKDRTNKKQRTIMAPHHKALYNLAHDMGAENFASQSLGFWQRQRRVAEQAEPLYGDTQAKAEIGNALAQRMEDLVKLGDAGAQMMRPLVGGEKGAVVDSIIAMSSEPRFIKDWRAVEVRDADGSTRTDWAPIHKNMADFAREAHDPPETPHPGEPKPNTPPSTADARAGRTASGAPAPSGPPAPTYRPGSESDSYPPDDAGLRYASGHPSPPPRPAAEPETTYTVVHDEVPAPTTTTVVERERPSPTFGEAPAAAPAATPAAAAAAPAPTAAPAPQAAAPSPTQAGQSFFGGGGEATASLNLSDEDLGRISRAVTRGVENADFGPNDTTSSPIDVNVHEDTPGPDARGESALTPAPPAVQRPSAEPPARPTDDFSGGGAAIQHGE